MSMFLTNNSPDLYALALCIVFRNNNLFLALLPGISAIWVKITDIITYRILLIFPEIFQKFPEILNFRKTYNPPTG